MIANQGTLQIDNRVSSDILVLFQRIELQEQAFAKIARSDAGGFELLNQLQGGLQVFDRERLFRFLLDASRSVRR